MPCVAAGEAAGAVGEGAQIDGVAAELDLGDLGAYEGAARPRLLGAHHPAAAPGQIAHRGAHEVVRNQHRHLGDRLVRPVFRPCLRGRGDARDPVDRLHEHG